MNWKKTPLDPLNKNLTKKLFQQTELFDAISVLLTDIVTHERNFFSALPVGAEFFLYIDNLWHLRYNDDILNFKQFYRVI